VTALATRTTPNNFIFMSSFPFPVAEPFACPI
jgi:hypothetical protein